MFLVRFLETLDQEEQGQIGRCRPVFVKVFVVDKWVNTPRHGTYGLVALLVAAAILLRLFMPSLPE
jgi:hypothetical protein